MRHNTLEEVFSAGADMFKSIADPITKKNNEKNYIEARANIDVAVNNIENWKKNNPYNGEDLQEYQNRLFEFTEKEFASRQGLNKSHAYQREFDYSTRAAIESCRKYSMDAETEWKQDEAARNLGDNCKAIIDNDLWTPQEVNYGIENQISLYKSKVKMLPQEEARLRRTFQFASYGTFFEREFLKTENVIDLEGARQRVREAFDFLPEEEYDLYDENKNVIGKGKRKVLDNEELKKIEDKAIEQYTARINDAKTAYFDNAQANMIRQIMQGNLNGAEAIARQYGSELNMAHNPKNESEWANLGNKGRVRTERYFDLGMIKGYRAQGEAGEIALLAESDYTLSRFIRSQMKDSDGNVIVGKRADGSDYIVNYKSFTEAMQGFLHYRRSAFMYKHREAGGEENAGVLMLWESERSTFMSKFYDEVQGALKDIDKGLAEEYERFRSNNFYITDKGGEFYNRDYLRNMSPKDKDLYAQRCVNFFESIFFNNITDVPTIKQMMREFTGREILQTMSDKDIKTETDSEKRFQQMKNYDSIIRSEKAEHTLFKLYAPNRINLSDSEAKKPTYEFWSKDHEDAAMHIAKEELVDVARILGLPAIDFTMDWMKSERFNDDVIAKGTFTIDNPNWADELQGKYRLSYGDNIRIVEKQNSSGGWEKFEEEKRPPTVGEQKDEIRKELLNSEGFSRANAYPGFRGNWGRQSYEGKLESWVNYEYQQRYGR